MKVAIIPARGGSKRIPGKNIKPFAGKPIIGYSIEAAIDSNLFDRIIVSTDSPQIAEVAVDFGAEVPFLRSPDLADDYTGTDAVIVDVLERLAQNNFKATYVCCLYATAPFVEPQDLQRGYSILRESGACSAFTVTSFEAPIFRSLQCNKFGRLKMIWPEYKKSRSQDLLEALHDAGQFYWADVLKYMKERVFWSTDAVPVYMPRFRVQDIDTPEDWEIAEKMFQIYYG